MFRIGLGSDLHSFKEGVPLVLCGVEIQSAKGLSGHGDGDVVLHALCDALLGAVSEGDLGAHLFPAEGDLNTDLDDQTEYTQVIPRRSDPNRPSKEVMAEVMGKVWSKGFRVINADVTIMHEGIKIDRYRSAMKHCMAVMLNVPPTEVSIKNASCPGCGTFSHKEGIFAQAIVLIERRPERDKSEF